MTCQEARAVLEELQEQCRAICDIAKIAKRNIKSLSGHNPYGERFHDAVVRTIVKGRNEARPRHGRGRTGW